MSVGPKYDDLGCFRGADADTSTLQRNIYSSRCIGMSVAQEERFSRLKDNIHCYFSFLSLWLFVHNPRCAGCRQTENNDRKVKII